MWSLFEYFKSKKQKETVFMENVKRLVNANDVYKFGYSGKGVRIALLDTGVAYHRELENRIIYFKDYVIIFYFYFSIFKYVISNTIF